MIHLFKGFEEKIDSNNSKTKQILIAGVCGLKNLGNTCFMNSALQCLSNIPILSEFSLKYNEYSKSQNNKRESKLLFDFYCELVEKLWSAKYSKVSPKPLRLEVSKIFQQFIAHQQNDCSEFLTLILDRFHEELKQMNEGLSNETIDSSQEIITYKSFSDYLKANNTFISNNFYGFVRFSLSCDCGQILLRNLNPFSIISLPQPIQKTETERKLTVIYMPSNINCSNFKLKSFEIDIIITDDTISVNYLLSEFLKIHDLSTTLSCDNLIVTQVIDHQIRYVYKKEDLLSSSDIIGDIYVYESDLKFAKQLFICLNFRGFCQISSFGIPLLININDTSFETIITAFKDKFQKFLHEIKDNECEKIFQEFKSLSFRVFSLEENKFIDYNYWSYDYDLPNRHILYVENISSELKSKYKMPEIVDINSNTTYFSPNNNLNVKLDEYLDQYLSVKKLTENNQIFCTKCQSFKVPNEKLDIIHAPNVLLLQLKSNTNYFEQNKSVNREYNCDFPIVLNLKKYVLNATQNRENFIYDLIAISNYSGSNSCGHYTTYAKNYINNKWYSYNDSYVQEISPELLFTSNAYLLVYLKRNLNSSLNE